MTEPAVPDPKPKPTNVLLIVGIVVGLIVLLCGGAVAGVVLWVRANTGDLKAVGQEMQQEAQRFAVAGTDRTCLEEGFRRTTPCGDLDIKCNVRASVFTSFCLQAAPATDGFCEGVPARGDFLAFTKFATQSCADRGLMGHQGCSQVVQQLASHCDRETAALPSP